MPAEVQERKHHFVNSLSINHDPAGLLRNAATGSRDVSKISRLGFVSMPEPASAGLAPSGQRARERFGDVPADEGFAQHVSDAGGMRAFGDLRAAVAAHENYGNVGP